MKRTKIIDVLQSTDFNQEVLVKGWVRTHRSSKAVHFIALNDGSTIKNVQIVVDPETIDPETLKNITTGACLCVSGTLVESQGQGQTVEIQGKEIEIYGLCGNDYPMQKKGQSFEYMRQHAHLRLRTNTFGAVMRIRHNMAIAIHKLSLIHISEPTRPRLISYAVFCLKKKKRKKKRKKKKTFFFFFFNDTATTEIYTLSVVGSVRCV